jgi:hypothetical protein
MPDKYNFDHLPDWGRITVSCIEIGCDTRGPIYYWTEEKRLEHYLAHQIAKGRAERPQDDFDLDALPTMALKMPHNNA